MAFYCKVRRRLPLENLCDFRKEAVFAKLKITKKVENCSQNRAERIDDYREMQKVAVVVKNLPRCLLRCRIVHVVSKSS